MDESVEHLARGLSPITDSRVVRGSSQVMSKHLEVTSNHCFVPRDLQRDLECFGESHSGRTVLIA